MFGIGLFELILVFCVALVVLGPTQLPEVARQIGVWYYRLRNVAQKAQNQMEEEFHKIEEDEDKKQQ
jgi:Tat protein translocase TatB subunit